MAWPSWHLKSTIALFFLALGSTLWVIFPYCRKLEFASEQCAQSRGFCMFYVLHCLYCLCVFWVKTLPSLLPPSHQIKANSETCPMPFCMCWMTELIPFPQQPYGSSIRFSLCSGQKTKQMESNLHKITQQSWDSNPVACSHRCSYYTVLPPRLTGLTFTQSRVTALKFSNNLLKCNAHGGGKCLGYEKQTSINFSESFWKRQERASLVN